MSTKKMTTSSLAAAAAAVMGLVAAPAGATLVTEWDYTVTLEWITSGPDAPTFTSGDGVTEVSSDVLSWGAAGGDMTDNTAGTHGSRSGLQINDSGITGSVVTGSGFVDTVSITHYNNRLSSDFATLDTASLTTNLTLTPRDPVVNDVNFPNDQGDIPVGLELSFLTHFTETPNTANEENCGFETVSNCDDIFTVDFEALQDTFTLEGITYRTRVGSDFSDLSDSICAAAGEEVGCFGLTTTESAFDTKGFGFSIDQVEVPTPGVLALFGSGLLALGAAVGHRRREDEE